jgi:hypothetical protein
MNHDPIRKALAAYLDDLEILQESAAGCTVASHKIKFRSQAWYEITAIVRNLGRDWVKARGRLFRGHWRIPKYKSDLNPRTIHTPYANLSSPE